MAGPVNPTKFSYNAPTENTDGSALPASKIAKYQLGFGQVSGTYTLIRDDVDFTLDGGKQVTPLSVAGQLAFGQWYAAARTVSADGPVSAWTPEVAFVLQAATPNPPSNFTAA